MNPLIDYLNSIPRKKIPEPEEVEYITINNGNPPTEEILVPAKVEYLSGGKVVEVVS